MEPLDKAHGNYPNCGIKESHKINPTSTLYKRRQMETIIKGKLDQKQNSHASWLVTTIKIIIRKPVKYLRLAVFSFKLTQETLFQNIDIFAAFDGNLSKAM